MAARAPFLLQIEAKSYSYEIWKYTLDGYLTIKYKFTQALELEDPIGLAT